LKSRRFLEAHFAMQEQASGLAQLVSVFKMAQRDGEAVALPPQSRRLVLAA